MSGKSKKPSTVNVDKITKLFDTYIQDPDDPDVLDMAGIGAFSEALGMDPSSDIRLLVLLWKLGSKYKPGCITRTEFCNGMKSLCIDSIPKLKTFLPSLDHGFLERSEFRDFFKFVFQFSREGTNKTIEKDLIIALFNLTLDLNRTPHLTMFIEFLQSITTHGVITLDEWESFLQFNYAVKADMSNYDENGAWPLVFDEYAEYRAKLAKNSGKK